MPRLLIILCSIVCFLSFFFSWQELVRVCCDSRLCAESEDKWEGGRKSGLQNEKHDLFQERRFFTCSVCLTVSVLLWVRRVQSSLRERERESTATQVHTRWVTWAEQQEPCVFHVDLYVSVLVCVTARNEIEIRIKSYYAFRVSFILSCFLSFFHSLTWSWFPGVVYFCLKVTLWLAFGLSKVVCRWIDEFVFVCF